MQHPTAFHLLAKPTGAACNLDCKYCFYLSKEALYPGSPSRMTEEVLEHYVGQLLAAQRGLPEVSVSWQGGEPTLMGLDFYRRAVALVERHKMPGQRIRHTMQTNGILLNDAWGAFFREHDFLVGLSIDGPKAMHDAYRVAKGGQGTFDQVMRAWKGLRRNGVETNILCTVHAANGDHGLEVYRFLRDDLGAKFIQFIPIVERTDETSIDKANEGWGASAGERPFYRQHGELVTERSVGPEQYGRFLSDIFDEWVRRDVGEIFVQSFDAALANWIGQPSMCIFSPTCGNAPALEHNGDLYACDHYVEPDHLLGNIGETDMAEMVVSPKQRRFGRDKLDTLPRQCRECEVLFACYGECPRNRFLKTDDGEPGLNYLCAGYKHFFNHIDRPMRIMADLLRQGRYADEIMTLGAADARGVRRPEDSI